LLGDQLDPLALTAFKDDFYAWSESERGVEAFAEGEKLISHLPEASKAIGLVGLELRDLSNRSLSEFVTTIAGQWQSLHERQEEFSQQRKFGGAAAMETEKKKLLAQFLVSLLSRAALIPTYSFPVHSCRLEVIQTRGTTSFIGAPQNNGLQLDRDATLAISEYAPGAEVVAGGGVVARSSRAAHRCMREINYATREQMACPRSRIRLSDLTAIATSVFRRASSRDFRVSPTTRL
jgi:hypothetical protein